MTRKEAYHIFGLLPGVGLLEIKKRYRQLMMQVHPDVHSSPKENYKYTAQQINQAYAVLKAKPSSGKAKMPTGEKAHAAWNAPVNVNAYAEREILHYAQAPDGTVFGNFCIAAGKYMWTTEEDFPLFLLSIYQCGKHLLDRIDTALCREQAPGIRQHVQTELTYLLAQQFIDGTALLEELAREEMPDKDGHRIFYISAMLELTGKAVPPRPGETLYPSGIRQHRLYLKNQSGRESGYLSFPDDRLYYIAVPLFEQKSVQVKIQAAEKQPQKTAKSAASYQNLHMWIKLYGENLTRMPESLNLQIEQLLGQYRLS